MLRLRRAGRGRGQRPCVRVCRGGLPSAPSHLRVAVRNSARRLLAFLPFSKEVSATPGGGMRPVVPGGVGVLAKLQGTAPYKESRQQIRTFRSGSGVQNPSSGPARPRLVRVAVDAVRSFFLARDKELKSAPGVGGRYAASEGESLCHQSWSEAKGIWQDGQADQRGKNLCGARGVCRHL